MISSRVALKLGGAPIVRGSAWAYPRVATALASPLKIATLMLNFRIPNMVLHFLTLPTAGRARNPWISLKRCMVDVFVPLVTAVMIVWI
jgi:hypothetical protein